jgi:hypothetical protein
MGDPLGNMRLHVLLFAYRKYSCISYALRRWIKIFHNHPFQGERMSGISNKTTVLLLPNPPQILPFYRRMTDRLHGSSDFYI